MYTNYLEYKYSLELAEDICILSRDAGGLKHCDPKGEVAADF